MKIVKNAEDAVDAKNIPGNAVIYTGGNAATPQVLLRQLAKDDSIKNVTLLSVLLLGEIQELFTKEYQPPKTDGSGQIRDNLKSAFNLLKKAGWIFKEGKLINDKTGEPLDFEILLVNPLFERIRKTGRFSY